jgi:hypothetical protein
MGRDTKYFFGNYFQVHFVPFIAIYDKNYKLKESFRGWRYDGADGGSTYE